MWRYARFMQHGEEVSFVGGGHLKGRGVHFLDDVLAKVGGYASEFIINKSLLQRVRKTEEKGSRYFFQQVGDVA